MKTTSLFHRVPELMFAWGILLAGVGLLLNDEPVVSLFGILAIYYGGKRLYGLIDEALR